MLYKTNILALVGGGKNPKYTPNKVILWDDYQTKVLHEFKFTTTVKNVKLKKDRLFVVCEQRIYVYETEKYKQIDLIDTFQNNLGVIGVNTDPNSTVLAFPDGKSPKGFMKIKAYEQSLEVVINAHDTLIEAIGINNDGTLIASASDKGKIIRIFHLHKGEFIEEFSRGKDNCLINYITFDPFSNWLAASTNKGMIHIYSLGSVWKKIKDNGIERKLTKENNEILPDNKKSFLHFLPNFLAGNSFKNSLSFAQMNVAGEESLCSFQPEDTIIAVTASGKYYRAKLNKKKGGECVHLKLDHLNDKENE